MPWCRPQNNTYRRPETEKTSDFWYISEENWQKLWDDVGEGGAKKTTAMNAIRKFDAAGRIMETDEGVLAAVPCTRCSREKATEVCMVFADDRAKACACCKRHAKSDCDASREAKPLTTVERVVVLEEQLKAALERIEELETGQRSIGERLDAAIQQFAGAFTDIATIWNKLWPSADPEEMQQ